MTLSTFDVTSKVGADFLKHTVKMEDENNYLEHYGVKGMKWGVRKDLKKARTPKARKEYLAKKDSKWLAKTKDPKKASRVARRASREAKKLTKQLNRRYKKAGYKLKGNPLRRTNINNKRNLAAKQQYETELKGILEFSLDRAAHKVYKNSPSRLYQVNLKRNKDGTLKAEVAPRKNPKIDKQMAKLTRYHDKMDRRDEYKKRREQQKKIKHSDVPEESDNIEDLIGLEFDLPVDEDGFVTNIDIPNLGGEDLEHSVKMELGEDFLEHYGVKGMKWGVRKEEDEEVVPAGGKRDDEDEEEKEGEEGETDGDVGASDEDKPKHNIGDFIQYPNGERVEYVSALGTSGKFLEPKEVAAADRLAKDMEQYANRFDDLKASSEKYEKELRSYNDKSNLTPEERKKRDRVERIADELTVSMYDAHLGYQKRSGELALMKAKAREAETAYYKNNPTEKRPPIKTPPHGVITIPAPRASEEEKKRKGVAHYDDSDYLEHYGVKGMKWGVRKDGKPQGYQGGKSSKKKKKTKSSISGILDPEERAKRRLKKAQKKFRVNQTKAKAAAYEKASKAAEASVKKSSSSGNSSESSSQKSNKVSSWSDDELRQAVARLDLEKRYTTLMAERQPKSRKAAVAKVVNKAASEAAGELLKAGIKTGAAYAVKQSFGVNLDQKGKKKK